MMTHLRPFRILLLGVFALFLMAQAPEPAEVPSVGDDHTTPAAAEDVAPGNPPAPASALSTLPGGSNIAIVPVEGMIYDHTLNSMERRIDRAIQNGADLIVIELDTNGGLVTSAIDICKYLKDPQRVPVPTVAWIRPKAYSAGIIIASACDEIVMSVSSTTGDSAPVAMGQSLEPTERAKILSPILAEYRDNAQRNGYDYAMFHAMTELGVQLYIIEHQETGERRLVNQVDHGLMVHGREPSSQSWVGSIFGKGSAGVNPDEMAKVTRQVATDEDLGVWQPVEKLPSGNFFSDGLIHNGTTLFTPDQTLAQDIGLSRETLSTEAEVMQHYSAASITRVPQSWSESFAGFLTNPFVKGGLVLALIIGVYLELQSPGIGVGAVVALIALLALLGAPFIIGLSDVWFVLVFILGLILLVIELLFTPSFGVLGIIGIVLMLAGLIFSAVPTVRGLPVPAPGSWDMVMESAIWTVMGLVGGFIGVFFLTKYFGELPLLGRLILGENQEAYRDDTPAAPLAGDEALGEGRIRVGDTGRVTTTGLRPGGRADFGGSVVDVVAEGGWIEPGRKVTVREVHGNRIVVDSAGAQ